MTCEPSKVGQGDLFLSCDQDSLVVMCVQGYKSLCAAVTICATMVNIQTNTQTDSISISLYKINSSS